MCCARGGLRAARCGRRAIRKRARGDDDGAGVFGLADYLTLIREARSPGYVQLIRSAAEAPLLV